jgi:TRAP-type C4-dicarboxylate transport system permease small subunit
VSAPALVLIFIAALAHASWNLFSKQASAAGGTVFFWLVAVVATVVFIPVVAGSVLVAHPHLTAANWVFMAGTGVLQAA